VHKCEVGKQANHGQNWNGKSPKKAASTDKESESGDDGSSTLEVDKKRPRSKQTASSTLEENNTKHRCNKKIVSPKLEEDSESVEVCHSTDIQRSNCTTEAKSSSLNVSAKILRFI